MSLKDEIKAWNDRLRDEERREKSKKRAVENKIHQRHMAKIAKRYKVGYLKGEVMDYVSST